MPISNAEGRIERDVLFPILEAEVFGGKTDRIGGVIIKNIVGSQILFCVKKPQKQICPDEFNEGESYRIYFDSLTKVIVKVE